MKEFWRRIFAEFSSVGIQFKIMGIIVGSILVFFAVLLWHSYHDVTDVLRNQLQQRGIAIGTTLAMHSGDLVLSENLSSLYQLVNNVREANKDVVYLFVLNTSGDVLVQTFDEGFPAEFMGKNQLLSGEPYHLQVYKTEHDTIQDVAVPIPGGTGIIRLGLTEASINAVVEEYTKHMLFWAALISMLWFAIAYFLSSILTRPVYRLLEAAGVVGQGDSRWQAPTGAKKDEIGRLGVAFGEMSKELKRREEIRQQLLRKVINAQEEERKRIALELHDQASQSLTSLIVGLKVLETQSSPETQKSIIDLKQLAAMTLAEIHNLAVELGPSSLDDLGLIAALRQYTREYSSKFGIEADFHATGLEEKRLLPMTEIALYRIVQEALTNVVRHAAATKVSVLVHPKGNSIVTIVEDDGKGFDVKEVFSSRKSEHRLGLYGMQERASIIGGVLTIESTPGVGTTIFVEVPLEEGSGVE
mgnify:FL=1